MKEAIRKTVEEYGNIGFSNLLDYVHSEYLEYKKIDSIYEN